MKGVKLRRSGHFGELQIGGVRDEEIDQVLAVQLIILINWTGVPQVAVAHPQPQ